MEARKSLTQLKFLFPTGNLASVMEQYRGVGPGFDFLRIALSVLIFYGHTRLALHGTGHSVSVTAGDVGALSLLGDIKNRLYVLAVPMFFALSGFLVTGSALRLMNVKRFLTFRVLRIAPALMFEVTISALILGIFFSKLPILEYIKSKDFILYFGNIFGIVHFYLPEVFVENPYPRIVNINLWTLPAEFYCYLILAAAMLTTILYKRNIFGLIFSAIYLILCLLSISVGFGTTPGVYSIYSIVLHFFVGVMFFIFSDILPMRFSLFVLSILLTIVSILYPSLSFLLSIAVAYSTVYAGFLAFLALPFMKGRDYSYGIYLFGFPVTQSLVAAFPAISRIELLIFGLVITLAISMFSWHFIEKPILSLKKSKPQPTVKL